MKNLFLLSVIFLCLATAAHAGDINAASCSHTAVQAAINSASNGDRVLVPAGSCTWTTTVTISNKGITLQGAGVNQTNITDQGSSGNALLISGASHANFVTLTGFTFIKGTDHVRGILEISGTQAEIGFRFHHLRLLSATSGSRGISVIGLYGLIDHVTFDVTASTGSIQSISVFGSPTGSDGGFSPWTRPLSFGTDNAVYIEDNTFNYGSRDEDCVDAYAGARLVIRHNAFNNAHIGFHGTDSGGMRSPVSAEVYSNIFANNTSSAYRAGTIRGGTSVWYNNSYGGSHGQWQGITILYYRACPDMWLGDWKTCDGTNWRIGSTVLTDPASRVSSTSGSVSFCSGNRELICTSNTTCAAAGAGTCTTFFDGSGTAGYPCRDQPGRGPGQALAPIYAWGNTGGVRLVTYDGKTSCGVGLGNYLQEGRDYYNDTKMPEYVAYTYPHPLQSTKVSIQVPAAPAILGIR